MGSEAAGGATGAAAPEEKGNLWSILPGFDPQQDDPGEYRDKVRFLHGICPRKDRYMLAPRLAMLMKGTAWAQIKQLDTAQLTDPEKGIEVLLASISTWDEAEEMQLYDKFEKALYRTTQRSDETTQSFVNRMSVSFHELEDQSLKDIRAFIMLRQSALSVEDKKRVLTMAGNPLTPSSVEKAMRQLSTQVLVGQPEGKKKVYPINYVEEEPEEIHYAMENEIMDEEQAIILMAEQGDDEAQLIKDFEDQLIEVCQDNQDLATCFNAYADARAKIRDRLRHRGFWPNHGQKGRGKGGRKGGKGDSGRFHRKKESLADRIAASNCRRCGARGHWKWECPMKDGSGSKEDVNVAEDTNFATNDPEIMDELPTGLRGPETIEELFKHLHFEDCRVLRVSPTMGIVGPQVNEEFMESVFVCSLTKPNVTGHCLGKALIGAMARKGEHVSKVVDGVPALECPGIIDTGASKTVIGQRKVKALIRSMPREVQKQMNWKRSETVFRFGNNAVLPSVGAIFLPFGSRWMRIEVVEGDTPFLLSNSFLRAIDADVCTRNSTLRLNQLNHEVPLKTNNKGLFVVQLAEVIAAFSREHFFVTNVTTELKAVSEANTASTAAEVAQRLKVTSEIGDDQNETVRSGHGAQEGDGRLHRGRGPATSFPRGPSSELHDSGGGRRHSSSTGDYKPETVGPDETGRREASSQNVHGGDQRGSGLCNMDEEASQAGQRLGDIVPKLCEGMGSSPCDPTECSGGTSHQDQWAGGDKSPADRMERGRRGVGADRGRQAQAISHECGTMQGCSGIGKEKLYHGECQQHECGSRSDSGGTAAVADCPAPRSAGADHQEHGEVREQAIPSNVSRKTSGPKQNVQFANHMTSSEVIQRGHEILCHLEELSSKIETELNDLMVASSDNMTRHALRAGDQTCKLDLLEVYCEEESNLTTVLNSMDVKAKRFTRQRHIWAAPDCKFWGNFSRWNSGRSLATAAKIQTGRENEKVHLKLCQELYWHQVALGRHFHMEQPQGSEAFNQKEVEEIVWGTYRTVFDMCEVGGLKIPKGNNYLRKRTVVLTTSKEFHSLLDARYCRINHEHSPILGQVQIAGRWQNLSAFAARYSKGFAKNVGFALLGSRSNGEKPLVFEELLVPCFGVREAEQQDLASDVIKRRKYSHKSPPRGGEEHGPVIPSGLVYHPVVASGSRYGPASTWKDVFKRLEKVAPRVGSVVVSPQNYVYQMIEQLVDQFQIQHVEVCRGTERYRVPKAGTDLPNLRYRLTIILNRESGEIEVLGNPEEWKRLPKGKQIRGAKPARMSITVFGDSPEKGMGESPLGRNLGEGDGRAPDSEMPSSDLPAISPRENISEKVPETGVFQKPHPSESMEEGYPPKTSHNMDLGI